MSFFAETSLNIRPFFAANSTADSVDTARFGRSILFPASARMILVLACYCNSFTQFLASSNESGLVISYTTRPSDAPL